MNPLTRRIIRSVILITFGLLVAASLVLANRNYQIFSARRDWKEQAIPQIEKRVGDQEWIRKEIAFIQGAAPQTGQRILAYGWLTDRMILMSNGDWLIYENHCKKAPPHHVDDIFIARASNGKWYYTTCHFCRNMIALIMHQDFDEEGMDQQPRDLHSFIQRYGLQEFDGKSNECLKKTISSPYAK